MVKTINSQINHVRGLKQILSVRRLLPMSNVIL